MYLNKHGALIEFLEYSHGKLRVGSKTSGLRKQKTEMINVIWAQMMIPDYFLNLSG